MGSILLIEDHIMKNSYLEEGLGAVVDEHLSGALTALLHS